MDRELHPDRLTLILSLCIVQFGFCLSCCWYPPFCNRQPLQHLLPYSFLLCNPTCSGTILKCCIEVSTYPLRELHPNRTRRKRNKAKRIRVSITQIRYEHSKWSECGDLNPGPLGPEPSALPSALHPETEYRLLSDSFCIIMIPTVLVKNKSSPGAMFLRKRRFEPHRPSRRSGGRKAKTAVKKMSSQLLHKVFEEYLCTATKMTAVPDRRIDILNEKKYIL